MKYLSFLFLFMPLMAMSQSVTTDNSDQNKWGYKLHIDKMTSDTEYFAIAKAMNKIKSDPSDVGMFPRLMITSSNQDNTMAIDADKHEFVFDANNSGTVRIRLDDGKPFALQYLVAQGGADLIFIMEPDTIIDKLKHAQKILVEADFIKCGKQIIEFDQGELDKNRFKVIHGNSGAENSWQYDKSIDPMVSDTEFTAYHPTKHILLKSAGNKWVGIGINVVYVKGTNYLLLSLADGKFEFTDNAQMMRIRFDDDPPLTIKTIRNDKDNQVVFDESAKLVERLKRSQKVLIEASFNQDGTKVLEFNTQGLVWNHTTIKKK